MICVIEDNDQIVLALKNKSIIFALFDFLGFKETAISNFSIFVINAKRLNNKGITSLNLIKNIKKQPYKKVIIVGDLDDMMKTYYDDVGVDLTTTIDDLCEHLREQIELFRKLKQLQKISSDFSSNFPEIIKDYNPKIILQIKHIFIKYLGVNSVTIIDSYVQQGLPYKKMLQEGYSLIDDDMKKDFLEELKNIKN